jgi:hypothetical protein
MTSEESPAMTDSTFPGATPRPIEIWRVEVYANGDKILNIEHGCLSGKERFSEAEEELVRECGRHLLGFVGAPAREDDDRFAAEIAQLHRHHLILRCRNGRSWITAFHHSLDGIEGLFSIPGGGIDGCRDHSNVRAIVTHIIKERDAIRTERDALKAEVQRLREAGEKLVDTLAGIEADPPSPETITVIARERDALTSALRVP